MVKVLKPIPKTLAKPEAVMKKKKLEKQSTNVALQAASKCKSSKISDQTMDTLLQCAKKTLPKKDEDIKHQPRQKNKQAVSALIPQKLKLKAKQGKKKEQQKQPKTTVKRPLVLAPPESPKSPALAKVKKNGSGEKKVKKKTLTKGPKSVRTKQQQKMLNVRTYQKQQLKKKRVGVESKPKAEPKLTFDPQPLDEAKFEEVVNVKQIRKTARALKTQVEQEDSERKASIFSDYRYFLNVASFKIPDCPHRMVKLNLKHSLVEKGDDVVIIVADLQRGAKVDYEPTIQYYEDVFRESGIEGLTIVPFNQLRTEYSTFETKRKFCSTYDYFLCDGRLVGHAQSLLGKFAQKPRTTFHSVRMDKKDNLKYEVQRSLQRTAYRQLKTGDLISIPVGNHNFTSEQLAENVEFVAQQLKKVYAGGWANIRSMHLKIDIKGTPSLPLYISLCQPPLDTPYVVGPREKKLLKLKKEANEVLSQFTLTKDAELIKLTKTQVERKRQIKETRAALVAGDNDATSEPKDDDGEESSVPTKKVRKVGKSAVNEKHKIKTVADKDSDSEDEEADGSDGDDEIDTDDRDAVDAKHKIKTVTDNDSDSEDEDEIEETGDDEDSDDE